MTKKIVVVVLLLFVFLSSINVKAKDFKYIEIFDPKLAKVVKTVQSNPEIQKVITDWITNIEGLGRNDPATDDGYAVKIPLAPVVKVHNKWINAEVSVVYIIIPEKEQPSYLIFESESRLMSFAFNGDIDILSNLLHFKLKSK